MKKLLFFTLFCLIGQILYSQKLTLTKATKEVTIDGAIGATDPWGSTWITASKAKGTTTGMSAKFQLTYDNDNLYFVAIVEDATRNTSCDSTWLNDCIEIFIAMDTTSGANGTYKKGDFQFRKRANDSLPVDGSSVLQIVTAKVLDNGISYTQEWAIPWKKMADIMDPAWDGKNFKFDVAFADATKPGERTQQQFWDNNSDSQWNNTTKFGWIKLLTPVLLLKSQSITFNDIPKILAGTADMTIPAFSSSGLALSYTSSNPNVVSIINGKLHVVAVGSCIITATQAGNAEFYAATAATRTVVVTTTNNVTPALTISKASKAPTIDAVVNANDPWGFNWISLSKRIISSTTSAMSAKFQMTYDDENLYIVSTVQDGTRNVSYTTNAEVYKNDNIEFYFSMDTASGATGAYKTGDYQLRKLVSKGINFWPKPMIAIPTVSEVDGSIEYTQEWAIPWAVLQHGMEPKWDGKYFKFEIKAADATADGLRTQQQAWNNNSDNQWSNTSTFGLIKLETPVALKDSQFITFDPIPNLQFGASDQSINAYSSSGLILTLTTSDANVATIVDGKIHAVSPGTATITANQAGNVNYKPAKQVSSTVIVKKADQLITFGQLAPKVFGDADFAAEVSVSSKLASTLSSSNTNVASIVDGKIHIVGAGTCAIIASQAGNSYYNEALKVEQTIVISKANQTMVFTKVPGLIAGNTAELLAQTNTELPIVFKSSNTSVATISGNVLTTLKMGVVTITASQAGNKNYNSKEMTQTVTIEANTSIKNRDLSSEISIYPNPVVNELRLSLPADFGYATIEVSNLEGKQVYVGKLTDNTLNIRQLASGTYILKVSNGVQTLQQKFVKK